MITTRSELHKVINLSLPGAEIGVASGIFSLEILSWGIKKLYLVDLWENTPTIPGMASWEQDMHDNNYYHAVQRLSNYPNAVFMKGYSHIQARKIPDNSLGFIYIDACHEYEYVIKDLYVWFPKLVKGGVCSCHDYKNPDYGVERAVKNFVGGRYDIHELPENGRIENIGCYFIKD